MRTVESGWNYIGKFQLKLIWSFIEKSQECANDALDAKQFLPFSVELGWQWMHEWLSLGCQRAAKLMVGVVQSTWRHGGGMVAKLQQGVRASSLEGKTREERKRGKEKKKKKQRKNGEKMKKGRRKKKMGRRHLGRLGLDFNFFSFQILGFYTSIPFWLVLVCECVIFCNRKFLFFPFFLITINHLY